MKKHLAILSLAVAGLCVLPLRTVADDATPPKPPGGAAAPAAGGRQGGGRLDPAERLKKMTEDLGLTQDQQDKIKAIFEKYGPQLKELMAKGRENLTDDDKTKFREILKNQTDDIAAVLTDEQKAKFKAAMDKRRADRAKQQ
jgi:Spy/CpxP family protein refolding chaperone